MVGSKYLVGGKSFTIGTKQCRLRIKKQTIGKYGHEVSIGNKGKSECSMKYFHDRRFARMRYTGLLIQSTKKRIVLKKTFGGHL